SACFRLGPDPRRALGPAAKSAAQTGRTRDRTRPMLQQRQKVLAKAPSTRDPKRTCAGVYAINRISSQISVSHYWNVTVAIARLTLSCGQKVIGPGAAPGLAILVPWPGRFRICTPAAFDTRTAPSIRNTPSA